MNKNSSSYYETELNIYHRNIFVSSAMGVVAWVAFGGAGGIMASVFLRAKGRSYLIYKDLQLFWCILYARSVSM